MLLTTTHAAAVEFGRLFYQTALPMSSGRQGISMDVRSLEDFLSLSQTRSFSRSAEERRITQPAFSRRIQALEAWLGASLVDRSTYPTTLTPAGLIFRGAAEEVLRSLALARKEIADAGRGRRRLSRDRRPNPIRDQCVT